MANYSIKQHNNTTNGSGTQTTVTCVFTSSQTAGGLNVVSIGWNNNSGTVTSVADTVNGTYTVGRATLINATGSVAQAVYYFPGIAAASANANTVTVTMGSARTAVDVRISEFASTNGTAWTIDQSTAANSSGIAPTSGNTSSTADANDLVYGAITTTNHIQAAGSGYTLILVTSPNANADEWKEVVSTGVQAATFTDTTSAQSVTQVIAFNAAPPPPVFVQANNANLTTSATTISVTPSGNVTLNNLIFVGAEYSIGSTETASIANTGTAGTLTWNALPKFTTSGTSNVLDYFGWWAIAPATGTCIPTVTFSISNTARGIVIAEYKPGDGKLFVGLDVTSVQTNKSIASTTLAGGAITPGDTDDVIVAFYKGGGTLSALASGWNNRTMNATLLCGVADCIPGTAAAQTFSATQASSAGMIQEFSFGENVFAQPTAIGSSNSSGLIVVRDRVQPVASSSSVAAVVVRDRVQVPAASVSSAAVYVGDITPITLASSSVAAAVVRDRVQVPAASVSSATIQIRIVAVINAPSVSLGLINSRTVFRSFVIAASTSVADQSYHTQTQIRPNAVILDTSACTSPARNVFRTVCVSSSSSLCTAVARLQFSPLVACSSSSLSSIVTELQQRPAPSGSSSSSGSATVSKASRPLPVSASSTAGNIILVFSAPIPPLSVSSAIYTARYVNRRLPISVAASAGSAVVRLFYRQVETSTSLSLVSCVSRLAERPRAGALSASTSVAEDEGAVIRALAAITSSSSSLVIAALVPQCTLLSSSASLVLARAETRVTSSASSSSGAAASIALFSRPVPVSGSLVSATARAILESASSIQSLSGSIINLETCLRPSPSLSSGSLGSVTERNQSRPLVVATSFSSSIFFYEDGTSKRVVLRSQSGSVLDVFLALGTRISLTSSSSVTMMPTVRLAVPLESDSSGTITLFQRARPLPAIVSTSASIITTVWIAPVALKTDSSVNVSLTVNAPTAALSSSSARCVPEPNQKTIITASTSSTASVFIGLVTQISEKSGSSCSLQAELVIRSNLISFEGSSADAQAKLLGRNTVYFNSVTSVGSTQRLQCETVTESVSYSSVEITIDQGSNYRPKPVLESDSGVAIYVAVSRRSKIESSSSSEFIPAWEYGSSVSASSSGSARIELLICPKPLLLSASISITPTYIGSLSNPAPFAMSGSVSLLTCSKIISTMPFISSISYTNQFSELLFLHQEPSISASSVSTTCTLVVEQSDVSLISDSSSSSIIRLTTRIVAEAESDSVSIETSEHPSETLVDLESDSEAEVNIEYSQATILEYQALFNSSTVASATPRTINSFIGGSINAADVRTLVMEGNLVT